LRDVIDKTLVMDELVVSRNPLTIVNIKEGSNLFLKKNADGTIELRLRHRSQRPISAFLEGSNTTPIYQLKDLLIK